MAFSAGSVMGFTVVGLGLLDITIWYFLLTYVFQLAPQEVASTMVTFGMGASSMALFARVGGGIFTKAADVGADLVGKVEAGIPEDDPRNPAVIADNVGDNVGDVAGMGADLYESYVGSILSASALGAMAFSGSNPLRALAIPMTLAVIGIICSVIGSLFVRTGESTDQRKLLGALRRGTNLSAVLIAVAAFPLGLVCAWAGSTSASISPSSPGSWRGCSSDCAPSISPPTPIARPKSWPPPPKPARPPSSSAV